MFDIDHLVEEKLNLGIFSNSCELALLGLKGTTSKESQYLKNMLQNTINDCNIYNEKEKE